MQGKKGVLSDPGGGLMYVDCFFQKDWGEASLGKSVLRMGNGWGKGQLQNDIDWESQGRKRLKAKMEGKFHVVAAYENTG